MVACFWPGLGVASSKHSTRLVRAVAALTRNIETVRKQFESNTIAKPLLQRVCQSLGTPVKLGVRMEAGQMILYDKNRSLAIMVLMQVEAITTQNR